MQTVDAEPEKQALSHEKPDSIDWDTLLDRDDAPKLKARGARSVENRPENILDSWIVVEVLSPEGYKTPEKLAFDLYGALMPFHSNQGEPWFNDRLPRDKKKSVYYLAYLGAVRLGLACKSLIDIYS